MRKYIIIIGILALLCTLVLVFGQTNAPPMPPDPDPPPSPAIIGPGDLGFTAPEFPAGTIIKVEREIVYAEKPCVRVHFQKCIDLTEGKWIDLQVLDRRETNEFFRVKLEYIPMNIFSNAP